MKLKKVKTMEKEEKYWKKEGREKRMEERQKMEEEGEGGEGTECHRYSLPPPPIDPRGDQRKDTSPPQQKSDPLGTIR